MPEENQIPPAEPVSPQSPLPQQTPSVPTSSSPLQPVVPDTPPVQQPQPSPEPTSVYPTPGATQDMVGLSASQMGYNQPKSNFFKFNVKKLLIGCGATFVIASLVFATLVITNVIPLFGQLKTLTYTNGNGGAYELKFYSRHSTRNTETKNTQLVSKVSKDGKLPVTLSISSGSSGNAERYKNCGSFRKITEVQNNNINQKIAVCDFFGDQKVGGQDTKDAVYVAVFSQDNTTHVITIGQDYSQVKLGSAGQAQESLGRFGLTPYKQDIETIITSIKVEK